MAEFIDDSVFHAILPYLSNHWSEPRIGREATTSDGDNEEEQAVVWGDVYD